MKTKAELLEEYKKKVWFEDYSIKTFDQPGSDGDTPIHVAALLGNLDDLNLMLLSSIDINKRGDIGNTALHYAALKGHEAIVEMLLKSGANPLIQNDYGDYAVDYATDDDKLAIKRKLLAAME
jgi:ankyrin repeat protein